MEQIPINEKYSLTIQEASEYFSIGVKKMRRLAEENVGRFSVFSGNRYLILREKFESFLPGYTDFRINRVTMHTALA